MDSIVKTLPEIDSMKSEISFLEQKLDDLEQYSRKNCLVSLEYPNPGTEKKTLFELF